MTGAYSLTHRPTGVIYFGSSKDPERRIWHHMWNLKNNRHANKLLQSVFTHEDDFVTRIVQTNDRDEAYALEQRWIDQNAGSSLLANECRDVRTIRGLKRSEETRLKHSIASKGRPVSEEQKANIRETLRGRKLTPEHVENQAATRRNRPRTPGELSHLQTIQQMCSKTCSIEGKQYSSVSEAAKDLGLNYQTTMSRIKSPSERWKEWYFVAV